MTTENTETTEELQAVIRALRANARKDAAEIERLTRQIAETNASSKYSCDFNYEQKVKAERERDEAREKLCKVLQILDDYDQAIKNPSSPFWEAFKKWFTWEAAK